MMSSSVADDPIEEILNRVRRRFADKPKVCFCGVGKSGKSSLFNAVYGRDVAKVSMKTDETTTPDTKERFGIDFTDTPGIGTRTFSLDKVRQMGVFERQNVIVHVLNGAGAISADDTSLHELIMDSPPARRVTTVNKADILDDDEKAEYAKGMEAQLGLSPAEFIFVSARKGLNVPELVRHIADILPDAMQDAFIGQQQANLALKEKRVRTLIYSKATICGAVALVPIPIADIFVITPIQVAMVATIGYFYGVEVTKERALELFGTMMAGVGFREAARQLVKLVPGWGSAVSAAIAFAGTAALGEVANTWFKTGMKMSAEEMQEMFRKSSGAARAEFATHAKKAEAVRPRVEELARRLASGEISQEEHDRLLADLNP